MENLTKPMFDNGIDEWSLPAVERGFLLAVIEDAETNLRDSSPEEEGLTEEEYNALNDQNFEIKNFSPEAVEAVSAICTEFCSDKHLDNNQRKALGNMDVQEQTEFGSCLCHALIYDSGIIGDTFKEAVDKFRSVDQTGKIGESVEGDYRIFFE